MKSSPLPVLMTSVLNPSTEAPSFKVTEVSLVVTELIVTFVLLAIAADSKLGGVSVLAISDAARPLAVVGVSEMLLRKAAR